VLFGAVWCGVVELCGVVWACDSHTIATR